nr:MAG TPA: hypothetical protein [Caudoviricetes sp.]
MISITTNWLRWIRYSVGIPAHEYALSYTNHLYLR